MNLDAMIEKMHSYNDVLHTHGFIRIGAGVKPWSSRHTSNNHHIDIRNSDWTAYYDNMEVATGTTVEELYDYLRNPR